jgi:TatD DNase family protein
MLIDPHCHLDDPELAEGLESALQMALASGVQGALIPSFGPSRWDRQTQLVLRKSDFKIWGAFGVHPWALDNALDQADYRSILEEGWRRHACLWGERLKAVGEFGLDRSARLKSVPMQLQRAVFGLHLEWARRLNKPVILHLVRADGEALSLLEAAIPLPGGVVHGFSGHAQMVPRYLELGLGLSFGSGLLRHPKTQSALRATPAESMMFETDAPGPLKADFPAPWGPHHLRKIIEAASQILGKSVEYLLARHSENCARIFRLESTTLQTKDDET